MLPVEPAKTVTSKIELEKSDPLTRLDKRGGFFWFSFFFSHRYSDGAGRAQKSWNELGIVPWVEKENK